MEGKRLNLELRSPDAFVRIVVTLDKNVECEVLNGRVFDFERDNRHAAPFGRVAVLNSRKIEAHFQSPVVRENSTVTAPAGFVAPSNEPGRIALAGGF